MERSSGSGRRRRRWSFGRASFDEGSWSLRINGSVVPLEAKPSELLLELLLRPGEAVLKEELLDAVWPGVTVVDASLSVAISKLRKALGDDAGTIIRTIPRIGYMLAAPVSVESLEAPLAPRFAFTADENVPGRSQWELVEPLGATGANDVWRARHRKTGQTRVFKFADAPDRLRSLKREASLFRLLSAAVGEDGPFAQLLEWNFETAPYFLESRDGGPNLLGWAEARGGLAQIATDRRLAVARAIACALAQVHDAGVLHKDLKPANIVIEEQVASGEDDFRIRLVDFGDGQVVDAALFDAYAITGLPMEPVDTSSNPAGTALYRAPELAGGALPTARSDIYALGLILYQLVVGDFRRTLAPGWEQDVADPLLRQDIADAAAGDPAQRIGSAAELADRLDRLDARRAEVEATTAAETRLQSLKADAERRKQRRPWLLTAAAAAGIGLLATTASTVVALRQRDEALHQEAIARASFDFLAEDLIGRVDPAVANAAEESVGTALRRASAAINSRFAKTPLVAGQLHQSLARGYEARADYEGARAAFEAAHRAFSQAGQQGRDPARTVAFQQVYMEARSPREGSGASARVLMDAVTQRYGAPDAVDGVAGMWAALAEGELASIGDHVPEGLKAFQRANRLAQANAGKISTRDRLATRQREIRILLKLDRTAEALAMARELERESSALLGRDHADTILAQTNIAQALMADNEHAMAVRELTDLLARTERIYGLDHPRVLQVIGSRMDSLKNMERYTEAIADGERLTRSAEQNMGPSSFFAIGSRADLGRSRCRSGDTGMGLKDAMTAWQSAAKAFGTDAALTGGAKHAVADCLLAAGRPEEARKWLAAINRKAVGELVGNAEWGLHVELLLAEIEARTGRPEQARQHLEAARPIFPSMQTDAYEARRIERVEKLLA